jgi:hypothetical protein
MIEKTIKYIEENTGIHLNVKKSDNIELKSVPYFIRDGYNFYKTEIYKNEIILIEKKFREPLTASQYDKQINILKNIFNLPVVLILENLQSYNRERLIRKGINFIIPGKQIFLPSLLISLKTFSGGSNIPKEMLYPASQVLLFYHLQRESLDGLTFKKMSELSGYTKMTISRAVRNMAEKNLCRLIGKKDIVIEFIKSGRALWESALPFLVSPVKKIFYTDIVPGRIKKYKTNISALSCYSDIADNMAEQYALSKNNYNKEIRVNYLNQINEYEGNYYFEVWNYDPGIITENEIVDPLSLYLTFKDDTDERIKSALQKMLNNIKW